MIDKWLKCASILLKDSIHSSWSCFRENNGSSGNECLQYFSREDAKTRRKISGRTAAGSGEYLDSLHAQTCRSQSDTTPVWYVVDSTEVACLPGMPSTSGYRYGPNRPGPGGLVVTEVIYRDRKSYPIDGNCS